MRMKEENGAVSDARRKDFYAGFRIYSLLFYFIFEVSVDPDHIF